MIGEYVTYNGKLTYAIDGTMERQMNKNLIIGNSYKIIGIGYNGYYIIDNHYYPMKSFNIDIKRSTKYKYNLK